MPDAKTTAPAAPEASAPTPGDLAFRYVNQARKATKANDGQPDERAGFLLKSANVLALLELADAVRGQNGS